MMISPLSPAWVQHRASVLDVNVEESWLGDNSNWLGGSLDDDSSTGLPVADARNNVERNGEAPKSQAAGAVVTPRAKTKAGRLGRDKSTRRHEEQAPATRRAPFDLDAEPATDEEHRANGASPKHAKTGRRKRTPRTKVAEPPNTTKRRARKDSTTRHSGRRRRKDFRPIRVFPRSVIGICLMLLSAGIGAAISGTLLFMQYQYRRDVSDAKVEGLDERIANGQKLVEAAGNNAQERIQKELEPLLRQAAIGETLERILADASPAVWAVRTSDINGAPIIGTGFVVASDSEKSFLVTSLAVVQASTVRPGPTILVRKGTDELEATLWTWQEERDLALLIVSKGDLPKLKWAAPADTRVGTQVFAISGLGSAGGAVTNGFVADVSGSGLQHTAPIGTAFQGGPIVNESGLVVAIGSRSYAPLGFASDGVWFATPVNTACEKLLRCPSGQVTGAGSQR